MPCDSCGREKVVVERDGRHLCLACLRKSTPDGAPDRRGAAGLNELERQYTHLTDEVDRLLKLKAEYVAAFRNWETAQYGNRAEEAGGKEGDLSSVVAAVKARIARARCPVEDRADPGAPGSSGSDNRSTERFRSIYVDAIAELKAVKERLIGAGPDEAARERVGSAGSGDFYKALLAAMDEEDKEFDRFLRDSALADGDLSVLIERPWVWVVLFLSAAFLFGWVVVGLLAQHMR